MFYGYARVSTQEQETHAQTDALLKAGVGFIFPRNAAPPAWQAGRNSKNSYAR